jgi:hypothetical protein
VPRHNLAAGLELHEDKRIKTPVRAVAVSNVSVSSPGSTIDGVSLATGDRVLLTGQSIPSQNGIYIFSTSTSTMSRASDLSSSTDFVFGFKVYVREGLLYTASYWTYTQASTVTVGSTSITFSADAVSLGNQSANTVLAGPSSGSPVAAAFRALVNADLPSSPTVTGEITAADLKVTGLTGATSGTRWCGATVSGSPASGTFAHGDVVVDLTGKWWLCTGAGSPGTWTQIGGGGGMVNPMTTSQDVIVGGTSGTPTRVGVGANGQVLTVNAGVVSWQNSASGFASPMTTIGDMISAASGGAAQRLAVGSNGQVLTVVGGQPGWSNAPGGGAPTNNVASSIYLARTCL